MCATGDRTWADALDGVHVLRRDGDAVVLTLDDPADDQRVLSAASAAGRVERFGWRQPSLAELYRDAVSSPVGASG